MVTRPLGTTIDIELEQKIRKLQSELIKSTKQNWSFSKVLNILIKNGLKNINIDKIIEKY